MPETLAILAVPSVDQLLSVMLRLVIAGALGGLLGFERESMGKAAGVRTHMLVALGAAVLTILITEEGSPSDVSRVMQGIAAGVGFIGAGTILKQRETGDIMGLTTAASIWMTASVGVGAGVGRVYLAAAATLCALAILRYFPKPDARNP